MENRTMVQHNGNTYNSDNSQTRMRGSLECVSVYVSELRRREAQMKLSEGNGVWCQCGGMYGELERRSVSGMSRWTYSVRGIGERRCPLTLPNFSLSQSPTIPLPFPLLPSIFLHTIDKYKRDHCKLNLPELLSWRRNTVPSWLLPYQEIPLLLYSIIVLSFHCL